MRHIIFLALAVLMYTGTFGQVKIQNTGNPDLTLILNNTNALNTGVMSRMFFKSGAYYTGGIGTVGTNSSAARLSFYTTASSDHNSLTERMTILNNGSVGIATSTPQYLLHLKCGGIGFTQESLSGEAKVGFYTANTAAYIQTHNNIPLHFATNNASAQMTLSTTGRLGIGTMTPVSKLEVKGKTTITQQSGEDAALELNGTIKVSGSNPAAFVLTAGADPHYIVIDHPASNGNPDAIILVTPRFVVFEPAFTGAVLVYYNHINERWTIYAAGMKLEGIYDDINIKKCDASCTTVTGVPNTDFALFTPGMKFNVLVIDK